MIFLTLALAVLLASPGHGSEGTWAIPGRVSVASDDVSLADLVKSAPEGWSAVAMGRAPRPGGERLLSRAWILQRAREVGAERALDVPETVVVARAGRKLDREEVVQAVEEALSRTAGSRDGLRVVGVGLPGAVPEGDLTLRVVPPEGDLTSAGTVWVEVVSQGRVAGRAWARVEAGRSGGVLALTRAVRKGDVLRPEDVEVRSDRPQRAQNLTDPSQMAGKRLVRSLAAGSAVSAHDLEDVPGVEKGQTVQLVARVGSVVATTVGKALERARIGDGVRVENVGSGRILQGVLKETGVVEIRSDYREVNR